eukprot:11939555-Alexandrium_andersonii.AAC.1
MALWLPQEGPVQRGVGFPACLASSDWKLLFRRRCGTHLGHQCWVVQGVVLRRLSSSLLCSCRDGHRGLALRSSGLALRSISFAGQRRAQGARCRRLF